MKKVFFVGAVLALIGVVVILFQMKSPAFQADDDPDIVGYIFSFDDDRILVAEGLAEGVGEYTGSVDDLEGDAIRFTLTEDTEVVDSAGDNLEVEDLALYQEVEVWATGALFLSYPAQGEASRVVLTGDQFDRDDAASAFSACDIDQESRLGVISEVEGRWGDIEGDISIDISGAWNPPEHYQFIGNQRILISFDDGHIMPMGVLEYECIDGAAADLSFIADDIGRPDGFPFESRDLWREVIENYGDEAFPVTTYVMHAIVDGELVEFDEWTETEEEVFVR